MPQIYPTPTSAGQGLTINTNSPLTGGGSVVLGGTLTLGLSTSNSSTRLAYPVTPAADGTTQNFTVVGAAPNLSIEYADLYISGELQASSTYTLSGNLLSINTAPASGVPVFLVFSSPTDSRQQYTLTAVSSTVFSFPSATPQGAYVDVYNSAGVLQIPGATGYYLDIVNGVYSVVFASAPSQPVLAVFDPSVNSGRQAYPLSPAANGTQTAFTIPGGSPSTTYIDIYAAGLFKMDGSSYDYSLSFAAGVWTVTFATAPASGVSLTAIFAPSTILPPQQSIGSVVNTLNGLSGAVTLSATSPVTLTQTGNNIAIGSSGGGGGYSLGGALSSGNLTIGAAAGTSPSGSIVGLDGNHRVQITIGITGSAIGTLFTVTFTTARGNTTYPIVIPEGPLTLFVSTGTASSTSYTVSTSSALTGGSTYTFNVSCP